MRLTVEKAKELLDRAKPEPLNAGWIRHSMSVGDTAAVIAEALHLDDPERARALGYVHDIGKYENPRDVRWHDVLGYEYLLSEGIDEEDAFICGVRIGARFILDILGEYHSQIPQIGET